ncbi:type II toxin-antitoxin system RelE/ParE family toxin [Methanospirillum hungatei]|uniref:type II toxin-antitoxin system RelE/ParE family toxin n=1 Tax=Methanospirillum hungatei TaxID=2203 RepID=UPI002A231500|nr:type II toxin-antitoxin system RelE/ParE family toxin [Methanospirillum hungatei]
MITPFEIEIAESAEEDLESIWRYIGQSDLKTAQTFVLSLEKQILTWEQFPYRCPEIPENDILGIQYRHLLHGSYRINFKIKDMRVIILRIIHGGQIFE